MSQIRHLIPLTKIDIYVNLASNFGDWFSENKTTAIPLLDTEGIIAR
jgi:hypothetical protein